MATNPNEDVFVAMVREARLPLYLRAVALYELFRRNEPTWFMDIAITTESASIGCVAVDLLDADLLQEDAPTIDLAGVAIRAKTVETAFAALSKIAARRKNAALAAVAEQSCHRLVRLAAHGILAEDDGK